MEKEYLLLETWYKEEKELRSLLSVLVVESNWDKMLGDLFWETVQFA